MKSRTNPLKSIAIGMAVLSLSAGAAFADDRYSLAETEGGTIRIDRQTGNVSYCKKVGSGVACTLAADERKALMAESEALETRVEKLEARLATLEKQIAGDRKKSKPSSNTDASPLTKEEEGQVDKAMRVTQYMMRRFIGVVKELKTEFESK